MHSSRDFIRINVSVWRLAEAARTRKAAERAARWAVVDKAAELADDVATTFLKCEVRDCGCAADYLVAP